VAREDETALQHAPAEQQQRWARNVQDTLGVIELQSGLVEAAGLHLEAAAAAEKAANPTSRKTAEASLSAARAALERGDLARTGEHLAVAQRYLDSTVATSAKSTRIAAVNLGARLDAASGRCAEALARLGTSSPARTFGTQVEFRDAAVEAELRADCEDMKTADSLAAALLAAIDSRQLQQPLALIAAQAQVVRARAALAGHDAAQAERDLRLALPEQEGQYDHASPALADSRLLLASALAGLGRPAQARSLVDSARVALTTHPALAARHGRLLDQAVHVAAAH
jgi:hypothetical protein